MARRGLPRPYCKLAPHPVPHLGETREGWIRSAAIKGRPSGRPSRCFIRLDAVRSVKSTEGLGAFRFR
jgi:hypothetical protein